jgi:predicted ester cyclase
MTVEDRKALVRRMVAEVYNEGRLEVLEELCTADLTARARAWIEPFRASFSDLQMEIVDLVAEADTVVVRFTCSCTHSGVWLSHPPTGLRFRPVSEVYFFSFIGDRISRTWGGWRTPIATSASSALPSSRITACAVALPPPRLGGIPLSRFRRVGGPGEAVVGVIDFPAESAHGPIRLHLVGSSTTTSA